MRRSTSFVHKPKYDRLAQNKQLPVSTEAAVKK